MCVSYYKSAESMSARVNYPSRGSPTLSSIRGHQGGDFRSDVRTFPGGEQLGLVWPIGQLRLTWPSIKNAAMQGGVCLLNCPINRLQQLSNFVSEEGLKINVLMLEITQDKKRIVSI
jgi:hypothetical protein